MAAKDAAIGVQLIQHHIVQIGKKIFPVGVIGQNAGVYHVGVAQDQAALATDTGAVGGGGVAVVGRDGEIQGLW